MRKFVLFDIDGTLIHSGGAGLQALDLALHDLTGISEGFREIHCAGKTDIQIIREGLALWGLETRDGLMAEFMDRYLAHLASVMSSDRGHVKPGVMALLKALEETPGVVLGLLTGNMEKGARIKLEPFGLNPFFEIGAYGSDQEDRNRLLPIALERFSQREGVPIDYEACVVIGDTPRDVACAQIHGAPCIAVATGPYPLETLLATGADWAVPDLSDTQRILHWIRGR